MSKSKQKIKLLLFIVLFIFISCKDESYFTQVYDKQLVKVPISCLKLKLTPFNQDIYRSVEKLYNFTSDDCKYTLKIKYKTNIGCNSPYNTNKSFHKFIELDLLYQNKLIYTVYKDLRDKDSIKDEIKKGYEELCKTIHL